MGFTYRHKSMDLFQNQRNCIRQYIFLRNRWCGYSEKKFIDFWIVHIRKLGINFCLQNFKIWTGEPAIFSYESQRTILSAVLASLATPTFKFGSWNRKLHFVTAANLIVIVPRRRARSIVRDFSSCLWPFIYLFIVIPLCSVRGNVLSSLSLKLYLFIYLRHG